MSAPGKPWITANQVTLARLVLMPLTSWLIYRAAFSGQNWYFWVALAFGTLIGFTDFIDGMLARKYGPTVLGGLIDPIADKVFIAFAYAPFADIGMVPAWACSLMFVREFFVTALRSAYEQRSLSLKTSYLAKAKTWTQMQGIGVMLLFPLIGEQRLMTGILIFGLAAPLVAMAGLWLFKRKFWRGALAMSGSFIALLAVHLYGDPRVSMAAIMIGVVAITWVSGLDYFLIGWRQLRGRGDFALADGVRLIGGVAVPALLFTVQVETNAPAWTILTILPLELAVGGLDNLLSHHRKATGALQWGARVIGISVLLAAALILPAHAVALSIAAAALSVVGVTAEFIRGSDYYMDARIRNKALRESKLTKDPGASSAS
ncbi:MAG: CDP-alcohol phosphatidyltransferase family protein [Myxococcales bacterium]|nr:CDP-alcohol phosphatidyltransferase family protein [Myxococcales bacterium]HRC55967.1 CDP-alcohol phosphatidyltransferase family protein [Kofleriaceae bacterium]